MQKIYNEIGIENYVYVSKINDMGIKLVDSLWFDRSRGAMSDILKLEFILIIMKKKLKK